MKFLTAIAGKSESWNQFLSPLLTATNLGRSIRRHQKHGAQLRHLDPLRRRRLLLRRNGEAQWTRSGEISQRRHRPHRRTSHQQDRRIAPMAILRLKLNRLVSRRVRTLFRPASGHLDIKKMWRFFPLCCLTFRDNRMSLVLSPTGRRLGTAQTALARDRTNSRSPTRNPRRGREVARLSLFCVFPRQRDNRSYIPRR